MPSSLQHSTKKLLSHHRAASSISSTIHSTPSSIILTSTTCKKSHFHTKCPKNTIFSSKHASVSSSDKNTKRFYSSEVTPTNDAAAPEPILPATKNLLENEPTYRTPKSALTIPNLFTHRYLPSEDALNQIPNKELVKEVLKVQDVPVYVDQEQVRDVKKKQGVSRITQIHQNVAQIDVSQYELHLEDIKSELQSYKAAYLLKLRDAIKKLNAKNGGASPDDISALIPEHFKKTVEQLKNDRKFLRRKRRDEVAALKAAKAATQNTKAKEDDEDEDEDDEEEEEGGIQMTADGQVASRSNLRLSYRDNYRIPFFTFEGIRKELKLLKLMDNANSAHRQYMIQCNLQLQEKQDVILRSLLKENNITVESATKGEDLAIPFSESDYLSTKGNIQNSAVLPLENAGVRVNYSSISKFHLQKVLRNGESAQDFFTLVDVRSRIRAFDCRLPGAVNIPLKEILKGALEADAQTFETLYGVPKIPQRHTVVFYGDHEKDAIMAAALSFMKHGYQNVLVYKGGVMEWFGEGYEPLWYRDQKVKVREFKDAEEWLAWYRKNSRVPALRASTNEQLRQFILRRLPDDLKTLQALEKYAVARMRFENAQKRQEKGVAQSLPLIAETDFRDGIPTKFLLSLVHDKLSQIDFLKQYSNADLRRIHEYQMHYGPRSQEVEL